MTQLYNDLVQVVVDRNSISINLNKINKPKQRATRTWKDFSASVTCYSDKSHKTTWLKFSLDFQNRIVGDVTFLFCVKHALFYKILHKTLLGSYMVNNEKNMLFSIKFYTIASIYFPFLFVLRKIQVKNWVWAREIRSIYILLVMHKTSYNFWDDAIFR